MPKTKISEFSSTPANNTDIDSIFIGEGMAPSNVNDAIRELMAQLKDWQSGTSNDPYVVGSSGSLTLNQGTANTVPYLNGSKVVTSGTALSFDGSNLGLGVTPSPWYTLSTVFQSNGYSLEGRPATTDYSAFWTNAYLNSAGSAFVYRGTGFASAYLQAQGSHRWRTAGSGSAGGTITFTEVMTLDASGNLGVGTTSPSSNGSGWHAVDVRGSTGGELRFGVDGGANFALYASASAAVLTSTSAIPIIFGNNNAERARIDSSGNLLLNTTSTLGTTWFNVYGATSSKNGIGIQNSSDTGTIYSLFIRNASNTTIGSINNNGSTTSFTTTSDYRLKENIQPMTEALAKVSALKPCTYTWKESGFDSQGFIAHELQAVVPDAVVGVKDAVDADGNPVYQGIDTSFLVATLTAAIQEQQAIIESLKARLDAANL